MHGEKSYKSKSGSTCHMIICFLQQSGMSEAKRGEKLCGGFGRSAKKVELVTFQSGS